jgi:3-hydroxyacyl-CoA dehydrogenase/enoyl-CoA hydratase/3-hydroxybutyryl-CoA epimerase
VPLARIESLVAARHLGRKTGQGYYAWKDGKAVKQSPEAGAVTAELTDRLMLMFANESVACLRERIVEDADLVDAGVIFGAGYAPFRGGPITWARATGPARLAARLEELSVQHGSRFAPDPGWGAL